MPRVQSSIVIDRPIGAVFAFAADYRNDPSWRAGVTELTYLSDDPVGVGIHQRETSMLVGRRVVTESRVSVYEPNERVDFEYLSGPYRVRGTRTFEDLEGRTRFTFALESEPAGVVQRLVLPALNFIYQRQLDGDLRRLKAVIEGRTGSPG
jgi:uncharacterized membrane protein